jgi:hypothetical protein
MRASFATLQRDRKSALINLHAPRCPVSFLAQPTDAILHRHHLVALRSASRPTRMTMDANPAVIVV